MCRQRGIAASRMRGRLCGVEELLWTTQGSLWRALWKGLFEVLFPPACCGRATLGCSGTTLASVLWRGNLGRLPLSPTKGALARKRSSEHAVGGAMLEQRRIFVHVTPALALQLPTQAVFDYISLPLAVSPPLTQERARRDDVFCLDRAPSAPGRLSAARRNGPAECLSPGGR